MRAVIYARYSSDNQREASIEDQVHNCRSRISGEGWDVGNTYADRAVSGGTVLRPGYQSLIEAARRGEFEIVVAEALDRLSRDQENIAGLYKLLSFLGIRLVTLAEGDISELHVGLKGTMNALFLKDLAQKTHRGLAGRVRAGKSGGGRSYGYDVIHGLDESGSPTRGDLAINDQQVRVIHRIFEEYVAGKSPRSIAIALNKEGVVGPSGRGWTPSTIIGNRKRGTGILNNQLYVGKRVWNRLSYRREPETGKRISQLNAPEEWIVSNVPELRLIEDDLWDIVQSLQEKRSRNTRTTSPDWTQRRPKHLLSGLIKCASCGGGMTLSSRVYFGCAASRNKGTCDNRLTIRLDRLEDAVLSGLQERLVTPQLTKTFVEEYTREINRLRAQATAKHDLTGKRLTAVCCQINNIVTAVADGQVRPALLDRLDELEHEKRGLEREMYEAKPDPIRLHPNITKLYVEKVANLREALNEDETRDEATTILRTLIDEIRLHPIDGDLQIELIGDLAILLGFASVYARAKVKPAHGEYPGRTKWLVAGARNQRCLHLDEVWL